MISLLVDAHQGDEGGDLEDKVHKDSHSRVNRKRIHGRHVRDGTDGKAKNLRASAEQDRWSHLTHGLSNVLLDVVVRFVGNSIVSVDKDKDIIDANGQDQEGNDLSREGGRKEGGD